VTNAFASSFIYAPVCCPGGYASKIDIKPTKQIRQIDSANTNNHVKIAYMNTTEIINCLGGTFAVAKMCRVSPAAVSQWKHNGLPGYQLVWIAAELEKKSDGKWNRKMVRNWQQIWPELH